MGLSRLSENEITSKITKAHLLELLRLSNTSPDAWKGKTKPELIKEICHGSIPIQLNWKVVMDKPSTKTASPVDLYATKLCIGGLLKYPAHVDEDTSEDESSLPTGRKAASHPTSPSSPLSSPPPLDNPTPPKPNFVLQVEVEDNRIGPVPEDSGSDSCEGNTSCTFFAELPIQSYTGLSPAGEMVPGEQLMVRTVDILQAWVENDIYKKPLDYKNGYLDIICTAEDGSLVCIATRLHRELPDEDRTTEPFIIRYDSLPLVVNEEDLDNPVEIKILVKLQQVYGLVHDKRVPTKARFRRFLIGVQPEYGLYVNGDEEIPGRAIIYPWTGTPHYQNDVGSAFSLKGKRLCIHHCRRGMQELGESDLVATMGLSKHPKPDLVTWVKPGIDTMQAAFTSARGGCWEVSFEATLEKDATSGPISPGWKPRTYKRPPKKPLLPKLKASDRKDLVAQWLLDKYGNDPVVQDIRESGNAGYNVATCCEYAVKVHEIYVAISGGVPRNDTLADPRIRGARVELERMFALLMKESNWVTAARNFGALIKAHADHPAIEGMVSDQSSGTIGMINLWNDARKPFNYGGSGPRSSRSMEGEEEDKHGSEDDEEDDDAEQGF